MTTRRVSWRRSDEVTADELCTVTIRSSGLSLVGTVIGAEDGQPGRVEYQVQVDGAGLTTAAHVRDLRGFDTRTIALERDAKGGWMVDGAVVKSLKGCTDVDLGCSPSTNTLPIRRLRLAVGASGTIKAALVHFPALTVAVSVQTYNRLDAFTYRFATGDFSAELTVDDDGIVTSYADWQRTGLAFGPEDTQPLDAAG